MVLALVHQGYRLIAYQEDWASIEHDGVAASVCRVDVVGDNSEWVRMANINVKAGATVCPGLAEFYRDHQDESASSSS
jgi:hypothetical protein